MGKFTITEFHSEEGRVYAACQTPMGHTLVEVSSESVEPWRSIANGIAQRFGQPLPYADNQPAPSAPAVETDAERMDRLSTELAALRAKQVAVPS